MPAAALPENETERLAALAALQIVGTPRSGEFDIFPALASGIFSTPIAAISLVDGQQQWFKASVGLEIESTARDVSFCAHAILDPSQALHVSDATKDPRFADNLLVTGELGIRFYAGTAIFGPGGHAVGALCVIDTQPREATQEMLEQLRRLAVGVGNALRLHSSIQDLRSVALADPLTGLDNRAGFEQRLSARLARGGNAAGLIFLDLDHFKDINDLLGHAGGDAALREVAARLRRATRSGDAIGRFGGDEFCILVDDPRDTGVLAALAARIHAALAEPFMIEQKQVRLRTSIGVATSVAGEPEPDALVRSADLALYEAKQAGRGTTRFATPSLSDAPAEAGRQIMEALLRDALLPPGREPFALALQPIYQGHNGALSGFEALVRWPDGNGRVLPPADFIPVAEATGLVVHLDRWVLNQACALAATWPRHLKISSNLSAANFFVGNLVEDVEATLLRHGLAPARLKLEITESVLLRDPQRMAQTIRGLRDLGVEIVLDDFGAGHASIGYLRDYTFDGLKIDRSFTAEIESNQQSQAFVRAIIDMARALGIAITAEGIETEAQLRHLRERGIGYAQGYLLGRPMTPQAAGLLSRAPQPQDHWRLFPAHYAAMQQDVIRMTHGLDAAAGP